MKRKTLLWLAVFTLVGFTAAGLLVIHFFHKATVRELLSFGQPWYIQLALGIAYGCLTGWTARMIILSDYLTPVRKEYARLIGSMKLSNTDILWISLCAGMGEEMLFRAGLQPLLGLWTTSILFVALHGYLSPTNARLSLYGIALTVIIAGMGVLFDRTGILSAMTAHAVIDIFLLKLMMDEKENEEVENEGENFKL